MTADLDDFEDLLGDVGLDGTAAGDSGPLVNDSDLLAPEAPETGKAASQAIPGLATESEMARLLGIAANRVRTLARDGMLHRPVRGRYDVRASLKTYIGDLRDKASRLGYAGGSNWESPTSKRKSCGLPDNRLTRSKSRTPQLVASLSNPPKWNALGLRCCATCGRRCWRFQAAAARPFRI